MHRRQEARDGLEIGGWNISVYFEATGEKRSGYPIVVTSDPWDMDTDSDGLTDGQEFENATHPDSADTDGDGMTDLWELTGPAPSDPCGIEGTPPNLSDLMVKTEEEWETMWVGVGPLALPVPIRTRNEINVTVTATDNVGLDWIRFHIDGKGEETVNFAQSTNNSTATVFFDHSFWSKWVSGYDLNITVSDVNGNEGYMEFHIDSVLEAFVQWLIGAVTALAEFVMELASAAIEWVWDYLTNLVDSVLDPIINAAARYLETVSTGIMNNLNEYYINDEYSDDTKEDVIQTMMGPFFFSVFTFGLIIIVAINIIAFVAAWLAWVIFAVILLIMGILLIKVGMGIEQENIQGSALDNEIEGEPFSLSYFLPSLMDEDRGSRDTRETINFTNVSTIIAIIILILQAGELVIMNSLNLFVLTTPARGCAYFDPLFKPKALLLSVTLIAISIITELLRLGTTNAMLYPASIFIGMPFDHHRESTSHC